ncbi:hypothetical protein [Pseudomonas sp. WS 5411]|uniref:hypothetical protein n=1 Tax=Pseudomonas sp. WS 5411 TaxID=2717486 RepID=UPI0021CCDE1F|nr:hypothetical protein [Pseudomonas sp. WS 5411]
MLKIRKVVVISPTSSHNRRLCTVVPISSTAPRSPACLAPPATHQPTSVRWLQRAVGEVRHDLYREFRAPRQAP